MPLPLPLPLPPLSLRSYGLPRENGHPARTASNASCLIPRFCSHRRDLGCAMGEQLQCGIGRSFGDRILVRDQAVRRTDPVRRCVVSDQPRREGHHPRRAALRQQSGDSTARQQLELKTEYEVQEVVWALDFALKSLTDWEFASDQIILVKYCETGDPC